MKYTKTLVALVITIIVELIVLSYVNKRSSKRHSQLVQSFISIVLCMVFWCFGLIVQILAINIISEDWALYIDYFVYIFVMFMPVLLFFFAYIFKKGHINFKKWHLIIYAIPAIFVLVLWTNSLHHLFYKFYSVDISAAEFGPAYQLYSIYSYGFLAFDVYLLIKGSIKTTSLNSMQTVLILTSALIPITISVAGATNIINSNIYFTPISFSATVILCGIAIFKYDFLNISPIALTSIVNQISDAYLVIDINNEISDCNNSFEKFFDVRKIDIIGEDFEELGLDNEIVLQQSKSFGNYLDFVQKNGRVVQVDAHLKDKSRYFTIEISSLMSDYKCVGILLLFKDTTQHIHDMEALKNNQDILMERERLATLGQMVGGIAHNLKTPIMSIAGAMDGLQDLVVEYEQSVGDPDVTPEDHRAIAHDMHEWINKVNSYDAYMSDVITAVKGQTANFSSNTKEIFTIDELLKRVNILMKHELKSALVSLNTDCQIDKNTTITGNVNSMVQIVNNLISNAIQSYKGKKNKDIDLTISEKDNNILISIKDYGCGIPEKIQEKLFSEMVTTKGHNGTGLGLFMSYSTIRGHFNGDLNFTSEVGKGSTFNIILPH